MNWLFIPMLDLFTPGCTGSRILTRTYIKDPCSIFFFYKILETQNLLQDQEELERGRFTFFFFLIILWPLLPSLTNVEVLVFGFVTGKLWERS